MAKKFRCKQPAGKDACGATFWDDELEEYLNHLKDHGVRAAEQLLDKERGEWWDEEGAFSIAPEDRVTHDTDVDPSQFGDGSADDRRRNAKAIMEGRQLARDLPLKPNVKASAYRATEVVPAGDADAVNPPKMGGSPEEVTASLPAGGVDNAIAGVQRANKKAGHTPAKKGRVDMGRKKTATPDNPYADVKVANLTVTSNTVGGNTAPRICLTSGQGFTDRAAITNVLTAIKNRFPNAIVVNQGKWQGDQLIGQIAQSMGIDYEMMLPKFLEERRRNGVQGTAARYAPEEEMTIGYGELKKRIAATCDELHVFGTPSGPQRGLIEDFNEAEKQVHRWGGALD